MKLCMIPNNVKSYFEKKNQPNLKLVSKWLLLEFFIKFPFFYYLDLKKNKVASILERANSLGWVFMHASPSRTTSLYVVPPKIGFWLFCL